MSIDYEFAERMFAGTLRFRRTNLDPDYAGRYIDNNTRLRPINKEDFAVSLHYNDIMILHKDGSYTLFDGGYRTNVTKKRLCDLSPVQVFQKKFEWYVRYLNGRVVPFVNGMRVYLDDNGAADIFVE